MIRTGYIDLKPCYALNCTERIERHKLMCMKHWHMVGIATRERVNKAWGSLRNKSVTGSSRAYLIAITKAKLEVACWEHCSMETKLALENEIEGWRKGGA